MAITCTMRSYFCIIAAVVLTVGISHCSVEKEWQHTIIINTFKGTQNEMGYDSSGRSGKSNQITCEDIDAGFQFRNSSTRFILRPGVHYLSSSVLFNSVNQLAIIGENGSNSTVVCRTGTGFSFINSTDITLQWVTYLGCGVLQNSTNKNFSTSTDTPRQLAAGLKLQNFLVSFYFYQCHDVILDHLTIDSSSSGFVMYETTAVMNSIFYDNSLGSNHSGGEVSLFCEPGTQLDSTNPRHNNSFLQELDTPVWNDVQKCSPGLTVPVSTCQCSSPYPYGGRSKCCMNELDVRNGFWIGNISDSDLTLFIGDGFYSYHINNTGNFYHVPNVSVADLDSYVCGVTHRTGILCGKCLEGYGPAVNDWDFTCVACNDSDIARHILKYFFATYVPLFLLFLCIIVFKVQLTTGPHAFLLYAQMISSVFDVSAGRGTSLNDAFSQHEIRWMLDAYYFVYGIFNLDFFSYLLNPYCLKQKFNTLDVLQLQYGVALFPLFMIIAVLLFLKLKESGCFSRCTQRFQNQITTTQEGEPRGRSGWRFADNLLHTFVAFTWLSYTKFGTSSTFILNMATLYGEDGKPNGTSSYRVYFAGQYQIDDKEYWLAYALPAVVILAIFVVLPPLLLLGPLQWFDQLVVPRVSCLQRYWPSVKVNIVLDAFQGCYKPHTRFFAGLYFVFRVAALINYATTSYLLEQYIIQQILPIVMVALLVIFQPYRRQLFNYVDTLIFLNMAILNALSTYILVLSETNPQGPSPKVTFAILYILLFLPLVYMISHLFYYIITRNRMRIARCFSKLWWCCCKKRDDSLQPLLDSANQASYGDLDLRDDTYLFARAEEANTFRPRPSIQRAMGLGPTTSINSENSNSRSSHTLKLSNLDSGLTSRSTPLVSSQSMGASQLEQ